jgi:hypothetical protein
VLSEIPSSQDSAKAARAMQAMLHMKKLDIAALKQACDGN